MTRHGPQEEVFETGCRAITHFAGGEKHGEFRQFDKTGDIVVEGQILRGEPSGTWIIHKEGGCNATIKVSDQGSGLDSYTERFANGKLRERGLLVTGSWVVLNYWPGVFPTEERHGEWRSYDPSGEVVSIQQFDRGRLLHVEHPFITTLVTEMMNREKQE
jgi:antitoxin component YwqK of YwqJK toxin-antitoxin module